MPDYGDRLKSEVVWMVKDYRSTTVTLYREDYDHMIEHHPIMAKNEEAVKDTISDPDFVYRDKEYDNRELYSKRSDLATYSSSPKKFFTTVVVEAADMTWTDARVVTAFPNSKVDGKESDKVYEHNKEL